MTTLEYIIMIIGFALWFACGYAVGKRKGRKEQVDIFEKVFEIKQKK